MTLPSTPLRSKFGRRLLVLFVGCALVPMAALASLSYRHVEQQLYRQSEHRLEQANLALGQAIFERLLLLDATLKSIPPKAILQLHAAKRMPKTPRSQPRPATKPGNRTQTGNPDGSVAMGGIVLDRIPRSPVGRVASPLPSRAELIAASQALIAGLDLLARQRFVAVEFVGDDGNRIEIFGRLTRRPKLTSRDRSDLRLGLPLIATEPPLGKPSRIFVLRRIVHRGEVRGTLVGEASPEYLWGSLDQSLPSQTTRVAVLDHSEHVIYSFAKVLPSIAVAVPNPAPDKKDTAAADSAAQSYLVSSSEIRLPEVFSAMPWRVVLTDSKEAVLEPMVEFTNTFLIVIVLSGLAVLLLSVSQIRRSVLPLEELQKGTQRIAHRDFASRVTVNSRDEFEQLAASFNTMAIQLGRQFNALATAAEIDRAVLSATDATTIVDTILARIRDVFPCSVVSVTLGVPEGASSLTSVIQDYESGQRHVARVGMRAPDVQEILTGPDVLELRGGASAPDYLEPLVGLGATSFVILPLSYQRQLSGIIVLGERFDLVPSEEDRVQMRRLADQAAVALANARMLDQVRDLAYYDSLTGLPNRLSYKERLAYALEQASRNQRLVAAFFIDLDHFSRINDTLGHEVGDQLLRQVAVRLRSCCREREDEVGPAFTTLAPEVARLGGDEFTVIMPGLQDPQDAAKLARRIISSFAQPIRLGTHEIFINASIGIAIYPFDGEDLDTLLMHADTAMYKAKEQGGNSYQTYSKSMTTMALQRLTLENDLRRALDRNEFEVHYQPIVDAYTGTVVGAEALLRWRHPELGLLLPSEFIPIAEENGLIIPMGEWILQAACLQNRAWQDAGLPRIRVGVNLSSRQLKRRLTDTVSRALQLSGLEPRYLSLELTESVLVNHHKEGTEALHALRAMGLHLSVDDFGTGYSSFSYLKHFPLDTLKIDRSFIREIAIHPDDAAITTAIIAMGHALGLRVIAEGVETEAHLSLLQKQGCDEVQGYLIGRPVPADRFEGHLSRKRGGSNAGRRQRSTTR
ncbi:MAG TPA: EAL domain-containing protein [Gemmatimonadales bacterium]|nr:EAL domain-containing protein [Gemmatimonadales bacterium]